MSLLTSIYHMRHSRTVVLNLWVKIPLDAKQPFRRGHLRQSKDAGINVLIHNSSKTAVVNQQWKCFYGRGYHSEKCIY